MDSDGKPFFQSATAGSLSSEGGQLSRRFNDHLEHGRAVAVTVQAQEGPLAGKSPGDSRDSGTAVRSG